MVGGDVLENRHINVGLHNMLDFTMLIGHSFSYSLLGHLHAYNFTIIDLWTMCTFL